MDEFEAELKVTLVETTTIKKFILQCEDMESEGQLIPQGRRYFYSTHKTSLVQREQGAKARFPPQEVLVQVPDPPEMTTRHR